MGVWQWRGWACLRGWALLGGLAAAGTAGSAEPGVPDTWLAYAASASTALAQRLARTDDDRVARLQVFLQQHPDTALADTLAVSLWIDERGHITRSQFASLGDAHVDADLRALLDHAALPGPPPPGMRQPLRLGLSLQAAEAMAP
ncbi:hypothetical protein KQ945_05870 [Bacillus subtilis subsp. subtilis]|nr:hypothetical protein [Bacillus subtilis subsp. subtilis]